MLEKAAIIGVSIGQGHAFVGIPQNPPAAQAMTRPLKSAVIDQALRPSSPLRSDPPHWTDDGLAILALLQSGDPARQVIAAEIRTDCPHRHSVCLRTGKHIPVTDHTIAAWAANPEHRTGWAFRLRSLILGQPRATGGHSGVKS